jgi:hypothetical protein
MCVQFLKSCVQFLMDTILNLAIVQFLIEKKGDARWIHLSCIGGKGRHTLVGCVSLFINYIKKDCPQKILHMTPLELHVARAHLDTCNVQSRRGYIQPLDPSNCHMFKSW